MGMGSLVIESLLMGMLVARIDGAEGCLPIRTANVQGCRY